MRIDFSKTLIGIEGDDLKWDDKVVLTLRKCAIEALQATIPGEQVDGEERFRRGELAEKIYRGPDPVELSIDEAKKVKEFIGKVFSTKIVHPAYKLLENSDGDKSGTG